MTKIGDITTNARNREVRWTACNKCGAEFWGSMREGEQTCFKCLETPGSEILHSGIAYVKLALDDPYYSMCPKRVGFFNGGWIRKSRYLMAKKLGRCLNEAEVVFHINHNNLDDSVENLELRVKQERTEEDIKKTRAYKFGYESGYEDGWEDAQTGRRK